jgi:hypothetical protein
MTGGNMNDKEAVDAYLESLVEELDAQGLTPLPTRPPHFGFTIREYMIKTGCSEGPARNILDQAVRKNVLVRHQMICGLGTSASVYCRPNEWPPSQ